MQKKSPLQYGKNIFSTFSNKFENLKTNVYYVWYTMYGILYTLYG